MNEILENLTDRERAVLSSIAMALRGLRFGAIHVTVHDSVVVQIEKTVKVRPESDRNWHYEI